MLLRKLGKITVPLGVLLLLAGMIRLVMAQPRPSAGSARASEPQCGFPPCGGEEDPNDHFEASKTPFVDVHAHFDAKFITDQALKDPERAIELTIKAMNGENALKFIMEPSPYTLGDPGAKDIEAFMDAAKKHLDKIDFQGGGGTLNLMIQQADLDGSTSPEAKQKFRARAEQLVHEGAVGYGEMTAGLRRTQTPGSDTFTYTYARVDGPLYMLLADVAAENDVPINLDSTLVLKAEPLPANFAKGASPKLHMTEVPETVSALERLLDHNPKAKIIWCHGGRGGDRSPELMRRLFKAHPNLYSEIMQVLDSPGKVDDQVLTSPGGSTSTINPQWLALFREFPDRFVIGSDMHYGLEPQLTGKRSMTWRGDIHFLNQLPADLRVKIAAENAMHVYPKAHWPKKS